MGRADGSFHHEECLPVPTGERSTSLGQPAMGAGVQRGQTTRRGKQQRPDAGNSSAYALALAAHGKFKDAQEYQAEAIFEATRARDAAAVAEFKATMQEFVKKQVPDKPWSAENTYFKAPLLAAATVTVAAPPKTP